MADIKRIEFELAGEVAKAACAEELKAGDFVQMDDRLYIMQKTREGQVVLKRLTEEADLT